MAGYIALLLNASVQVQVNAIKRGATGLPVTKADQGPAGHLHFSTSDMKHSLADFVCLASDKAMP